MNTKFEHFFKTLYNNSIAYVTVWASIHFPSYNLINFRKLVIKTQHFVPVALPKFAG